MVLFFVLLLLIHFYVFCFIFFIFFVFLCRGDDRVGGSVEDADLFVSVNRV